MATECISHAPHDDEMLHPEITQTVIQLNSAKSRGILLTTFPDQQRRKKKKGQQKDDLHDFIGLSEIDFKITKGGKD